ncbi:hypothetical protein KIN20_014989 [Parelaphostrongylus tenuis]|uniref:RLR CTR domain-containing protein n=1 Tax=Parelaphostrongylus tenuis TaxID=148309 RepID=A0AAD5MHQ5_PARTN|nr:hypothetical protein KIN20_014989 [Parelaphostrongylus tenuis]
MKTLDGLCYGRNSRKSNRFSVTCQFKKLRIKIQSEDALDLQRMTQQKSSNKFCKLLYGKCDEFLCISKDIKTHTSTQLCVCNPDIWSRTYSEKRDNADARAEFGAIGKYYLFTRPVIRMYCTDCHITQHHSYHLPQSANLRTFAFDSFSHSYHPPTIGVDIRALTLHI